MEYKTPSHRNSRNKKAWWVFCSIQRFSFLDFRCVRRSTKGICVLLVSDWVCIVFEQKAKHVPCWSQSSAYTYLWLVHTFIRANIKMSHLHGVHTFRGFIVHFAAHTGAWGTWACIIRFCYFRFCLFFHSNLELLLHRWGSEALMSLEILLLLVITRVVSFIFWHLLPWVCAASRTHKTQNLIHFTYMDRTSLSIWSSLRV